MKLFILAILILCAGSALVLASPSENPIDGVWKSEMQVGDTEGKTHSHLTTVTLKANDGVLTGTVVQTSSAPWMAEYNGKPIEITNGKIDGAKFSFSIKLETAQGERTSTYEGSVEGDHLKGTIKYRGIGMTRPFDATRAH